VSARVLRFLFLAWCAFIAYGSFIPFHFDTSPDVVRARLAEVQLYPYQDGVRNFSRLDVVSNVLLFVPFGFLLTGPGFWRGARGWILRIATAGALAALFSLSVEIGQLFSPGRTASVIDVEADVAGAVLGACLGWVLSRLEAQRADTVRRAHDEPRLVGIALMALWLASDALYPFAVTLDVSTLWHNLKQARWIPFHGSPRFWLDRVVDQAVMFGMLAALVAAALERYASAARAAVMAAGLSVALSAALEAGKLFVVGRSPNVENVILAVMGSAAGATIVPAAMRWRPLARHARAMLAVFALALLAYAELTPFAFDVSSPAVAAQVRRIEWIPLSSYYGADAQSALFDLWRKLLLSGFWGFAFARLRGAGPLTAGASGLVVGSLLEGGQVFLAPRVPSVTDVSIIAVGSWIGGAVCRHYRRIAAARGAPAAE